MTVLCHFEEGFGSNAKYEATCFSCLLPKLEVFVGRDACSFKVDRVESFQDSITPTLGADSEYLRIYFYRYSIVALSLTSWMVLFSIKPIIF